MTRVRTIQREEADEFLTLLCGVFNLDLAQAKQIFFTEPTFDLSRKWACFVDGRIRSILTTSPLKFGWGRAIGIAGVATDSAFRGKGLARMVLEKALAASEDRGEGPAMLFAHDARLYNSLGFEVCDEVIRGEVKACGDPLDSEDLTQPQVARIYDAWSAGDSARLVREPIKWDAWTWTMKHCESRQGGYVCVEPVLLREVILPPGLAEWPVPKGSVWYGLKGMSDLLQVPFAGKPRAELKVMSRGFPAPPRMFMTDQF